jgi:DNA-binding response OmpR family regulator
MTVVGQRQSSMPINSDRSLVTADSDQQWINVPEGKRGPMSSVLLVEDDDQLRAELKLLLIAAGYEVLEASSGKLVEHLYQQHHPDLVVTDLLMPDKDGLEVIMDLRRHDRSIRIIAMSEEGQRSPVVDQVARKFGAVSTLSKPFLDTEFVEAVRLALESTT